MRTLDLLLFAGLSAAMLAMLFPSWIRMDMGLASFGDLYSYHYPMRHLVQGALHAGRIPFWNPYILCGLPLAANSQSVLFYPGSLAGNLFPLTLALSWDSAFHWLWGALGMWLLARRGGLNAAASLLLAALFSCSPFLVYRITEGIPTLLAALAWAPWCWLAWDSGRPGLLAAAWALQFFSGHAQFSLINAAGMAAWGLTRPCRGLLFMRLLGEGAAAGVIAAVQVGPTYEFLGNSLRSALPEVFSLAYAVSPATLKTLWDPGVLGDPLARTWGDVPSVFFETCGVFLGKAGVLVALAGLALGAWRAAVVAGLGLFMGAGGYNPVFLYLWKTTALGYLRTPGRWVFLSLWGLIIAAGWALKRSGRGRWASVPALAVALLTLAELLPWDRRFLRVEPLHRYLAYNDHLAGAAGGRAVRIMTDPEIASPNKSLVYRAMNVNGYEAFFLEGYPAFVAASEGRPAADTSRVTMTRYDSPLMSLAGVRYFVSLDGDLHVNRAAHGLATFEGKGAPPQVRIPQPERWLAHGRWPAEQARLIIAQAWYPGWRAWINGREALPEKWLGFFQSLSAGGRPGDIFELRLRFQPTLWPFLAALSASGWLFWLRMRAS